MLETSMVSMVIGSLVSLSVAMKMIIGETIWETILSISRHFHVFAWKKQENICKKMWRQLEMRQSVEDCFSGENSRDDFIDWETTFKRQFDCEMKSEQHHFSASSKNQLQSKINLGCVQSTVERMLWSAFQWQHLCWMHGFSFWSTKLDNCNAVTNHIGVLISHPVRFPCIPTELWQTPHWNWGQRPPLSACVHPHRPKDAHFNEKVFYLWRFTTPSIPLEFSNNWWWLRCRLPPLPCCRHPRRFTGRQPHSSTNNSTVDCATTMGLPLATATVMMTLPQRTRRVEIDFDSHSSPK